HLHFNNGENTHTRSQAHTNIHTHAHTHTHTHTHTRTHTHTHTHTLTMKCSCSVTLTLKYTNIHTYVGSGFRHTYTPSRMHVSFSLRWSKGEPVRRSNLGKCNSAPQCMSV